MSRLRSFFAGRAVSEIDVSRCAHCKINVLSHQNQHVPPPEPIPQVCVVPFRLSGERIEICLITSLKKQRWILPKGIVDPAETREESALKEALEEAGLHGRVVGEPLGEYEDFKWGRALRVTVLMMDVTRCDDTWFEADVRQRRWVSPQQASELLSHPEMRRFVEVAVGRILND